MSPTKHPLLTLLLLPNLLLLPTLTHAQLNLSLLGRLDYTDHVSDVWGYEDQVGNSYALVGTDHGLSIVSITTPAVPTQVAFVQDSTSLWHDMKVWEHYAYVINQNAGGLTIIDLSNLPGPVTHTTWDGGALGLEYAHNFFVDENGIGYIIGSNVGVGGVIFVDLVPDPMNPTYLGIYDHEYVHDVFVRGDTMWTAEILEGVFSVVDVSDKANPVILANQQTPNQFTHNVWLSDDGHTLYTTDETNTSYVVAYDVSDLGNITELDRIQSSPGMNVPPHNVFVVGDFLVASYYADGAVIFDATHPDILVEVGNFDTSPAKNAGFNGCWGVYPYLSSGLVLASDQDSGLYVLSPTYQQGAYIKGQVRDTITNGFLWDVDVEIIGTTVVDKTDLSGKYSAGVASGGTYDVRLTKYGYYTKVITGVNLVNGAITTLDVQMREKPKTSFTVTVVEAGTSIPIPNALVWTSNDHFNVTRVTDTAGIMKIFTLYEETYTITIGKWGYVTQQVANHYIDPINNTLTVGLEKGYYDDFALDFNWTTIDPATNLGANWDLGEPLGTTWDGKLLHPDEDIQTDFSDRCYSTGNSGIRNNYHWDGITILMTPEMDLSDLRDPFITYYTWFADHLKNSSTVGLNDSMVISVSNGVDSVTVETIFANANKIWGWDYHSVRLTDHIALTANMRVTFALHSDSNLADPNQVEGGLDVFYVIDSADLRTANLSISNLNSPASACDLSDNEAVSVVIVNNGPQIMIPGDTLWVSFELDGGGVHQEYVVLTADFEPGDSIIHTFQTKVDLAAIGNYTFDLIVDSPSDTVPVNNQLQTTVQHFTQPSAAFGFSDLGNGTIQFNATQPNAANYQWLFGDATTASGQDTVHQYGANGSYEVVLFVTSTDGCEANAKDTIQVNSVATAISEHEPIQYIKAYPNPTNHTLNLLAKGHHTLTIHNLIGQPLLQTHFTNTHQVPMANYPSGIYLIKIDETTLKIIVE